MITYLALFGLLGSSTGVAAFKARDTHELSRRTVDLSGFSMPARAKYVTAGEVAANPSFTLLKRDTYLDTATELLRKVVPGATFRTVQDHYVGTNGVAHVYFKQTANGLDIDNADFNVNIGADGAVFSYGNNFFLGPVPSENPLKKRDFMDPVKALRDASSILQLDIEAGSASTEFVTGSVETYILKGITGVVEDPQASLVYFIKGDGSLVLTWRVETNLRHDYLLSYVDAQGGVVHGVANRVAHAASYEVYPWGVSNPTEGSRSILTDPWNLAASEFTWQGDGFTVYNTTQGNNAIAAYDPDLTEDYMNSYRPLSPTKNFEYPYSPDTVDPASYINASITQLFYTVNTYHDLLYLLGFNEAAGNFEMNNNGQGGVGDDFVFLSAQDGWTYNNAQFYTPPEGRNGVMYMYLFTQTTPWRDCSFQAEVVIHEYTHGVSNRLTGGPANVECLNSPEAGGMGEGWGDFMGSAIMVKPEHTRDTDQVTGAWVLGNTGGVRNYPYSTSLARNPWKYTDIGNLGYNVHTIGEVWATTLFEVMWNLIDKYGKNDGPTPEFDANGVPTDGKYLTMKLVIDGMALQPCTPNMIQARDAILDADKALTGGVNACDIWKGFAKRGLGEQARYSEKRRRQSRKIPDMCKN